MLETTTEQDFSCLLGRLPQPEYIDENVCQFFLLYCCNWRTSPAICQRKRFYRSYIYSMFILENPIDNRWIYKKEKSISPLRQPVMLFLHDHIISFTLVLWFSFGNVWPARCQRMSSYRSSTYSMFILQNPVNNRLINTKGTNPYPPTEASGMLFFHDHIISLLWNHL